MLRLDISSPASGNLAEKKNLADSKVETAMYERLGGGGQPSIAGHITVRGYFSAIIYILLEKIFIFDLKEGLA